MKHWPVQDAKARFSEMLDASVADGPQMITKRGVETAVLVPVDEWRRLHEAESARPVRPTLKELLLTDPRRFDLDTPKRGAWKPRPPVDFE